MYICICTYIHAHAFYMCSNHNLRRKSLSSPFDIERTWLTESTKQGLQRLSCQARGLRGSAAGPLLLCNGGWVFLQDPLTVGSGMALILLPAVGVLYLLLGCLVQLRYQGFCFVLLYPVLLFLLCPVGLLSFKGLLFCEGKKKRVRVELREGEVGELGEVERGETTVWVYCIKEGSIFKEGGVMDLGESNRNMCRVGLGENAGRS